MYIYHINTMDPKILPQSILEENDILKFTLHGVNMSLANALRRTILSEIDIIVFKAYNEEVNMCTIHQNTTSFNNEIIKQRLGCIPIHINNLDIPLKDYELHIEQENVTDTIQYITTENFKIKNTSTGEYLSESDRQRIFPPSDITGYYIDFLRLKPKISDDIKGEALHLTCKFSTGNAKENGMYNAVSCCAYGYTIDDIRQEIELNKLRKQWKDQGMKPAEIAHETTNWKLLDGLRITKPDSFDFTIESIGIYTNQEIIHKACDIIVKRLEDIDTAIEKDKLVVKESNTTIKNSYDVILNGEDYTIGKILEYVLYTKYWQNEERLTFCGFVKEHPHYNDSIIRLGYTNESNKAMVLGDLKFAIQELVKVYKKIKTLV